MLSIKKIINNNVVLVVDSKLREFIAIGKGIGFNKNIEDLISEDVVEKKYSLLSNDGKLLDYMQDIDYKLLTVCDDIKLRVEERFNTKYTNYLFFGLVDHINTAITRSKLDIHIPNTMSDEEVEFYEKEIELAKEVVDIINKEFNVELTKDETSFIALHFITLNYNVEYSQANEKVLKITRNIMNIIRYESGKEIEDDFNVQRFQVHLKYFIIRQLNNNKFDSQYNDAIYKMLITQYEMSAKVLDKIVEYVESKYGFLVEPDERMYLLIHLVKIVN